MTQSQAASLDQLKRALDAGLIDQATFAAATAAINAQAVSGAAAALGHDSLAVGAGGVVVGGNNEGVINLGVLIQQGGRSGASAQDLRRAYLARVFIEANRLPLFASDNDNAQIKLSSVYTALLTQRSENDRSSRGEFGAERSAPGHRDDEEIKRLSALEVLNAEPKLVLLGGPGSGKTTFIRFVVLSMAGELLGSSGPNLATLRKAVPEEEGEEDQAKPQRWDHGALLPVHITLRDLASQLPAPGMPADAETVWRFICSRLDQAMLGDFAVVLKDELLGRGGLILLDGLDEVPDALGRRERIKQAVQEFAKTFFKCRFLVTSRTYAYQRQDWKLDEFAEVQLLPFTLGQIRAFVDAWYADMVTLYRLSDADAKDRAGVLKRTIDSNQRIRELAERPLLLTLIARLQTEGGGALPEKREELYDKAVEMLLNEWESLKVRPRADGTKDIEPSLAEWLNASRDGIRKQLNRLAFEAHRDQEQLTGTADIRQEKLITELLRASASKDVKVRRLEDYLRDRAGILAAHGVGMYQFPHRSFQEYLAACHLTDDEFPEKLANLTRGDPGRWREVALLAGAKAARGSSLSVWALSEALCLALPPEGPALEADHWGALLAGRVLSECADLRQVAPRDKPKLERVREWQRAIMRRNTLPAVERALAGRTLAKMGDPRPEVMTLDGMHFCFVPPGPFVMGADRFPDERPTHTVDLPYPYFIARFPVTVVQWREYLELGGGPARDERGLHGRRNDPVVYVSWHDAMRFCNYLTEAWRGQLPKGFVVTLPSEAEWEKAARGGERIPHDFDWVELARLGEKLRAATSDVGMPNPFPRRDYPWGESWDPEKANAELSVGETSAVGCYPTSFSPYGCEDMSGNVWEWTRSRHASYPYRPDDGRENVGAGDASRVLRGGAWGGARDGARGAARHRSRPGGHRNFVGFRVVLLSAPVV